MEYLIGYIAGVITIGVLRLLELSTAITTESLTKLLPRARQQGTIILPQTPNEIADKIIKEQPNDL